MKNNYKKNGSAIVNKKVQFNIIEGEPDDYWDHYEAFVKLYNNEKHSVTDIQKILELSQAKYRRYRSKALIENRLKNPRNRTGNRYGYKPKYYTKTSRNSFTVKKWINGANHSFGTYPSKEIAEKIVRKLMQCNWDRTQLNRIKQEVMG